jgi:hypothetical protein
MSPKTIQTYRTILSKVESYVTQSGRDMNNLTRVDVQGYIHHMEQEEKKPTTIHNQFACISSFLRSGSWSLTESILQRFAWSCQLWRRVKVRSPKPCKNLVTVEIGEWCFDCRRSWAMSKVACSKTGSQNLQLPLLLIYLVEPLFSIPLYMC